MVIFFVIVTIFVLSISVQHYIPTPDQCILARTCNHTWIAQCGHESNNLKSRWFSDNCDMYEYNCDHKKSYIYSEDTGCSSNITKNLISNMTTVSVIESTAQLKSITKSNSTLPYNSTNKTLLTSPISTVRYRINNTAMAINTTLSSRKTTLSTTFTILSTDPETISSLILPNTYPTQNITSSADSVTSITKTLPIPSTSLSGSITEFEIESTPEFSLLSSVESTTKIPEILTLESTARSSRELVTPNMSGSCTSMTKTTDSITQSITKPTIQSTTEITALTEPSFITEKNNVAKKTSISTPTSTNKYINTKNMTSIYTLFKNNTLITTAMTATVIATKNSTAAVFLPSTLSTINSTSINSFLSNGTEKVSKSDDDNTVTNITNDNSFKLESNTLNSATIKNEMTNTTSNVSVTINENTITVVKCKVYPKDCNVPVTWETTEMGERRDFYQILKARFGNKLTLLRHTTQRSRRTMEFIDDTDSFLFGLHNEIKNK